MSDHNLTPEQERDVESHAPYMKVFWSLLVLTILEYAYAKAFGERLSFAFLVAGLMVLAVTKAFLVGWYFMHLKFEKAIMRWLLVISVTACFIIMYFFFFPDADRVMPPPNGVGVQQGR